jgi:hypothetical protein
MKILKEGTISVAPDGRVTFADFHIEFDDGEYGYVSINDLVIARLTLALNDLTAHQPVMYGGPSVNPTLDSPRATPMEQP